jgi:hypothetical protein
MLLRLFVTLVGAVIYVFGLVGLLSTGSTVDWQAVEWGSWVHPFFGGILLTLSLFLMMDHNILNRSLASFIIGALSMLAGMFYMIISLIILLDVNRSLNTERVNYFVIAALIVGFLAVIQLVRNCYIRIPDDKFYFTKQGKLLSAGEGKFYWLVLPKFKTLEKNLSFAFNFDEQDADDCFEVDGKKGQPITMSASIESFSSKYSPDWEFDVPSLKKSIRDHLRERAKSILSAFSEKGIFEPSSDSLSSVNISYKVGSIHCQ